MGSQTWDENSNLEGKETSSTERSVKNWLHLHLRLAISVRPEHARQASRNGPKPIVVHLSLVDPWLSHDPGLPARSYYHPRSSNPPPLFFSLPLPFPLARHSSCLDAQRSFSQVLKERPTRATSLITRPQDGPTKWCTAGSPPWAAGRVARGGSRCASTCWTGYHKLLMSCCHPVR